MRYERVKDIIDLAIRLQAARGGLTLDDIEREMSVSRRTAERMRDAVDWAFGPLDIVPADDNKRHWRLQSNALRNLLGFEAEELTALATAAAALERTGLQEQAAKLREIGSKLRAMQRGAALERLDADLETLTRAEGLAMRPGPRQPVDAALLALLREAILTRRVVTFRYRARSTGRQSRQRVEPYGLLYGNRAFLVARAADGWSGGPRLWRLANVGEARLSGERFERDPAFDLQRYARRSFGTFQETPVRVVLRFDARAADDAAAFLFHPDQTVEAHDDGTLTVRFTAGGLDEMCWHLVTWGDSVTVEKPARLRRRLAEMCERLAGHHG
ncbi:MAG: WYL domain-containing protein [Rhodospirillaceae bacterium]|nr:WYL domain-containing protein [Rhodospirillaceae bacterium]MYB15341.1 WYL domain-containing protein [Rhodospirillaceae bacterium]MYI47949.1 WYL domain-containing protein [Rhodospirillaceae bacterium]